jgi:hypothetical protein
MMHRRQSLKRQKVDAPRGGLLIGLLTARDEKTVVMWT